MKKSWLIGAVVLVLGVILGVLMMVLHGSMVENSGVVDKPVEKFPLSVEMYDKGEVVEITASEFNQLVTEKKSFVVVLHMVVCPAEFPVTNSAKELAHSEGMVIYSLVEDEFKQTFLAETIKYLPSVAIIHEGELAGYLDAEADKDVRYYKTAEGLKEWMEQWIEKGENEMEKDVSLEINGKEYRVVLEDNVTAKELMERLPLTISMSELNGNEKYFYFDRAFSSAPGAVGRVEAGDLMLYGDDCLVLFYESFETPYAYTRIGWIENVGGLKDAVGKGNVRVKFELN